MEGTKQQKKEALTHKGGSSLPHFAVAVLQVGSMFNERSIIWGYYHRVDRCTCFLEKGSGLQGSGSWRLWIIMVNKSYTEFKPDYAIPQDRSFPL